MTDEQRKKAAKRAVASVVSDITDRRGLRQEWEGIDARTRAAIKRRWEALIGNEFSQILIDQADQTGSADR